MHDDETGAGGSRSRKRKRTETEASILDDYIKHLHTKTLVPHLMQGDREGLGSICERFTREFFKIETKLASSPRPPLEPATRGPTPGLLDVETLGILLATSLLENHRRQDTRRDDEKKNAIPFVERATLERAMVAAADPRKRPCSRGSSGNCTFSRVSLHLGHYLNPSGKHCGQVFEIPKGQKQKEEEEEEEEEEGLCLLCLLAAQCELSQRKPAMGLHSAPQNTFQVRVGIPDEFMKEDVLASPRLEGVIPRFELRLFLPAWKDLATGAIHPLPAPHTQQDGSWVYLGETYSYKALMEAMEKKQIVPAFIPAWQCFRSGSSVLLEKRIGGAVVEWQSPHPLDDPASAELPTGEVPSPIPLLPFTRSSVGFKSVASAVPSRHLWCFGKWIDILQHVRDTAFPACDLEDEAWLGINTTIIAPIVVPRAPTPDCPIAQKWGLFLQNPAMAEQEECYYKISMLSSSNLLNVDREGLAGMKIVYPYHPTPYTADNCRRHSIYWAVLGACNLAYHALQQTTRTGTAAREIIIHCIERFQPALALLATFKSAPTDDELAKFWNPAQHDPDNFPLLQARTYLAGEHAIPDRVIFPSTATHSAPATHPRICREGFGATPDPQGHDMADLHPRWSAIFWDRTTDYTSRLVCLPLMAADTALDPRNDPRRVFAYQNYWAADNLPDHGQFMELSLLLATGRNDLLSSHRTLIVDRFGGLQRKAHREGKTDGMLHELGLHGLYFQELYFLVLVGLRELRSPNLPGADLAKQRHFLAALLGCFLANPASFTPLRQPLELSPATLIWLHRQLADLQEPDWTALLPCLTSAFILFINLLLDNRPHLRELCTGFLQGLKIRGDDVINSRWEAEIKPRLEAAAQAKGKLTEALATWRPFGTHHPPTTTTTTEVDEILTQIQGSWAPPFWHTITELIVQQCPLQYRDFDTKYIPLALQQANADLMRVFHCAYAKGNILLPELPGELLSLVVAVGVLRLVSLHREARILLRCARLHLQLLLTCSTSTTSLTTTASNHLPRQFRGTQPGEEVEPEEDSEYTHHRWLVLRLLTESLAVKLSSYDVNLQRSETVLTQRGLYHSRNLGGIFSQMSALSNSGMRGTSLLAAETVRRIVTPKVYPKGSKLADYNIVGGTHEMSTWTHQGKPSRWALWKLTQTVPVTEFPMDGRVHCVLGAAPVVYKAAGFPGFQPLKGKQTRNQRHRKITGITREFAKWVGEDMRGAIVGGLIPGLQLQKDCSEQTSSREKDYLMSGGSVRAITEVVVKNRQLTSPDYRWVRFVTRFLKGVGNMVICTECGTFMPYSLACFGPWQGIWCGDCQTAWSNFHKFLSCALCSSLCFPAGVQGDASGSRARRMLNRARRGTILSVDVKQSIAQSFFVPRDCGIFELVVVCEECEARSRLPELLDDLKKKEASLNHAMLMAALDNPDFASTLLLHQPSTPDHAPPTPPPFLYI